MNAMKKMSSRSAVLLFVLLPIFQEGVLAFIAPPTCHYQLHNCRHAPSSALLALGDFVVELPKPLGLILEERDETNPDACGVKVKEITDSGSASTSQIAPGDILLKVDDTSVESASFDQVMDLLTAKSPDNRVSLTIGDGLGTFDMPKNVVKFLQSKEDAFFVDAVVRQAVREARRNGRLGEVLRVEVIVGAGVTRNGDQEKGVVRFFAIFSTDSVSTYSCNVAATGIRKMGSDDGDTAGPITIVSLSCAKDEGLGATYDLISDGSRQ